ncbi:MAG: response regulator, partial [Betaproteobacteria bacterium]|nr:response regulator [Betaproteobacteria bacterium]
TILTLYGHEVYEAADGLSGAELAISICPDIALIDIGLPGIDGYEVARRVRASPGARQMKLVAFTGYGQEEDLQRARLAGFDACLVKPLELGALERILAGV